jgi:hypothetical protein
MASSSDGHDMAVGNIADRDRVTALVIGAVATGIKRRVGLVQRHKFPQRCVGCCAEDALRRRVAWGRIGTDPLRVSHEAHADAARRAWALCCLRQV